MTDSKKPPLAWKLQERFERGGVVAELNTSTTQSGKKIHSFSMSCLLKEGKLGRHFRKEDIDDMHAVLEEVHVAIDADTSFDNRPFKALKAASR